MSAWGKSEPINRITDCAASSQPFGAVLLTTVTTYHIVEVIFALCVTARIGLECPKWVKLKKFLDQADTSGLAPKPEVAANIR